MAEEEKAALHDYMAAKLRQYLFRTGVSLSDNDVPEYQESLGSWLNGPVSEEEEGISEEGKRTKHPTKKTALCHVTQPGKRCSSKLVILARAAWAFRAAANLYR